MSVREIWKREAPVRGGLLETRVEGVGGAQDETVDEDEVVDEVDFVEESSGAYAVAEDVCPGAETECSNGNDRGMKNGVVSDMISGEVAGAVGPRRKAWLRELPREPWSS
jgi:hypothetical protein